MCVCECLCTADSCNLNERMSEHLPQGGNTRTNSDAFSAYLIYVFECVRIDMISFVAFKVISFEHSTFTVNRQWHSREQIMHNWNYLFTAKPSRVSHAFIQRSSTQSNKLFVVVEKTIYCACIHRKTNRFHQIRQSKSKNLLFLKIKLETSWIKLNRKTKTEQVKKK